jgi:hypothetical protein
MILCLVGLTLSGRCLSLSPAAEAPQAAVERIDFEGKWDGKFTPSVGEPGEGKYEFGKEKDGKWDIKVSWLEDKKPKSMPVKGERLGPDALRLEGKYKDTKYWYIGRMEGKKEKKLVFRYLSVNETTGESGTGESVLTRAK